MTTCHEGFPTYILNIVRSCLSNLNKSAHCPGQNNLPRLHFQTLGPIMFNIYVADIPNPSHYRVISVTYTDETVMFATSNNPSKIAAQVAQTQLDALDDSCALITNCCCPQSDYVQSLTITTTPHDLCSTNGNFGSG